MDGTNTFFLMFSNYFIAANLATSERVNKNESNLTLPEAWYLAYQAQLIISVWMTRGEDGVLSFLALSQTLFKSKHKTDGEQ